MKIHELKVESAKDKKRVGRGIGSGTGKTAGRGTKGQNSRTGGGVRPGFEGGQNPLAKRLPKKRGFRPYGRVEFEVVNLQVLENIKEATITNKVLSDAGIITNEFAPVKVLGTGTLSKKVTVKVQAATKSAREAIQNAGGVFEKIDAARTPKKPSKRNRVS